MWTDSGGSIHTASEVLRSPIPSAISGRLLVVGHQKITGPDDSDMTGFVIIDLDDASRADGVVRSAKKVLVDGARTLARSRTYAWALMGHQISGRRPPR